MKHLLFLIKSENFTFADPDKISKYCIFHLGHNAQDIRGNSYLVLLHLAQKSKFSPNALKLLKPVNFEIFQQSQAILESDGLESATSYILENCKDLPNKYISAVPSDLIQPHLEPELFPLRPRSRLKDMRTYQIPIKARQKLEIKKFYLNPTDTSTIELETVIPKELRDLAERKING